jgi:hypothetical protein
LTFATAVQGPAASSVQVTASAPVKRVRVAPPTRSVAFALAAGAGVWPAGAAGAAGPLVAGGA